MTKTEQDEKITEWLSWGMHNGVCPEVLAVAALAIGAAQERSQYPHGKAPQEPVILTGNNPEDGASQTARGLVQPGVAPRSLSGTSESSVERLGEKAAYHWREARELMDKIPMPDPKEWEEWGSTHDVDPAVLDYLKNYPEEDKD